MVDLHSLPLPPFLASCSTSFLNFFSDNNTMQPANSDSVSSASSPVMDAQTQSRAAGSPSNSPSSPLSVLSRSPSIPSSPPDHADPSHRYPSPSSSSISTSAPASSGAATPIKLEVPDSTNVSADSATMPPSQSATEPPRKRRKIAPHPRAPKERTTEYLDLNQVKASGAFDDQSTRNLSRLVDVFRKTKKVVVIAGAGISVSAGIPDFRSKNGLFATLSGQMKMKGSGKDLFDASVYKDNASTGRFHQMVCQMDAQVRDAKPTLFHHMLASLASEDRLMRLYSQNVDCIDTNLPPLATNVPLNLKGPWPKTIQLHGSVGNVTCSKCTQITPMKSELFVGQEAPLCQQCKELDEVRTAHAGKRSHGIGRLRPRMVLYNEFNPDSEAIGKVSSADLKRVPDAVIVVGTSLQIPGVRRLVKELTQTTRSKRGGFTAWINVDSEPQHNDFKDCWDLVVRGKADDVAHFVQLPRWDEPNVDDSVLLSKEDDKIRQEWLRRDTVEVVLGSRVDRVQGIPTPNASPKIPPTLPNSNIKAVKTKQSKLSFGPARKALPDIDSDTSTASANNKRKRAPAKAGKQGAKKGSKGVKKTAEPPKNNLKQVFRTTKKQNSSAPVVQGKKPDFKPTKAEESPPAPSKRERSELPSLRPDRPPPRDAASYASGKGPPISSELSDAPPSSPTRQSTAPSRQETVKPSHPTSTPQRTKLPSSPSTRTSLPSSPPRSSPCIGVSTTECKGSIVAAGTDPERPNTSPCIGVSTTECKGSIVAAGMPEQPSTPPTHHRRASSVGTISPTSVPRGMESLMD